MQSEPAVVAQVFLHKNCFHCAEPCRDWISTHLCPKCGTPQPVLAAPVLGYEDYFLVLGVERKFTQDKKALEKNFYEASRALHPDRFTTAPAETRSLSMGRMTLLNEAYTTLKNPDSRRIYLLELEGVLGADQKKPPMQPPMELAESWFEIQDLLVEDREQALLRVTLFEKELENYRSQLHLKIAQLEKDYDFFADAKGATASKGAGKKESLIALALVIQPLSYLASLSRDVERIKAHAHSN